MSPHAEHGAYFQYADIGVVETHDTLDDIGDWSSARAASEWRTADGSWVERAMLHARLREELHREHQGLTNRQLDAIASMTVDLRQVRVRLGSVGAMLAAATAPPR